jgi:UDP-N-acetylmuramate--alanine ligase
VAEPEVGAVTLDLASPRRLHVANVGGAGMSAVATLLVEMGHQVSGHDPASDTPFLAPLRARGVHVTTGPGPATLPADVDAVIVSTATPADDADVAAAQAHGIPVVHRSGALTAICAPRQVTAVAGTHGKTTTSALLATVLAESGMAPGWVVGAGVPGLGSSASWGGGGPLVVEADESDGTFLALGADTAIVTNVEPDHLEHWGGEAALRQAFVEFVSAVPGPTVLCLDDPGSAELVASARHPVTYGTDPHSDYRIADVVAQGTGVAFELHHEGARVAVTLPAAPGIHNARNGAAALAMAHRLGLGLDEAVDALGRFRGVARRFEVRGEAAGVVLVDSYDHLPTEVVAALAAARAGAWRRVVCCFQPHRYSRTDALWRSFADAFEHADVLAVTGIYAAGESPRPGVTGKRIVDAVLDAHPWRQVAWLPTLDDVVAYLGATLRAGDLCLTLGAGDLTTVPDRVLAILEAREA